MLAVNLLRLMEHMEDRPWPGCQVKVFGLTVTWMSSAIASMVLVAVFLSVVLVVFSHRRRRVPRGAGNVIEAVVVFVRDMIARPALHERAYDYLPFLLTLFVFILGMNLFGLVPLQPLTIWLGGHVGWMRGRPAGGAATSVPTVCAGLASLTLLAILASALWRAAIRCRTDRRWPIVLCVAASPGLWFVSLAPNVPGITGRILAVPLALLELAGAVMRCVALVIRLCANMLAGHMLLAVLLMFALSAASSALHRNAAMWGVSVVAVLGGVLLSVIEMLVAGLQAYIFTFLTAMFLGLYAEPSHQRA